MQAFNSVYNYFSATSPQTPDEGSSDTPTVETTTVDKIAGGIEKAVEYLKTPEEFVRKYPHLTMMLIVVATIMYDDSLDFKRVCYFSIVPALKLLTDRVDIPVINKLRRAFSHFVNECSYLTYMTLFFAGPVLWGKFPPLSYPALGAFTMNDLLNANNGTPPLPSIDDQSVKIKKKE